MADLMTVVRQWEANRQKQQVKPKPSDKPTQLTEPVREGSFVSSVGSQPTKSQKIEEDGSGPPWPGYNGGKQFVCGKCRAHFDTSAGYAQHSVYGCDYKSSPAVAKTLPSCPKCGSYYLQRDGTCMTCSS